MATQLMSKPLLIATHFVPYVFYAFVATTTTFFSFALDIPWLSVGTALGGSGAGALGYAIISYLNHRKRLLKLTAAKKKEIAEEFRIAVFLQTLGNLTGGIILGAVAVTYLESRGGAEIPPAYAAGVYWLASLIAFFFIQTIAYIGEFRLYDIFMGIIKQFVRIDEQHKSDAPDDDK